jgi:hypothetical protein
MLTFLLRAATTNVFPIICYLLAAYFLYACCLFVGVPPTKPLDSTSGSYLALALFLFMLPEAKKLKLGQLFEFEAKVKEIKQEVRDFKEETRSTLSAYTSLISAISNTMNQTINVHLPGQAAVAQAKQDLKEVLKTPVGQSGVEAKVETFIESASGDIYYALAKLRMQLERELQRILDKRITPLNMDGNNTNFQSARSLFSQFAKAFPEYERIRNSFDYVLKVCNAGIHGQIVPEGHAREALFMGIQMLDELANIEPQ